MLGDFLSAACAVKLKFTCTPSIVVTDYSTMLRAAGTDYTTHPIKRAGAECCDNVHHPRHYIHVHQRAADMGKATMLGNTTGRMYRV